MVPVRLPCKCSNAIPLSVTKDNVYRVRASPTGCQIRHYAKLLHLNFEAWCNMEPQFYWNNCACNEFDALTRRHLLGHIPGFISGNPELTALETNLVMMSNSVGSFTPVSHKVLMEHTRSSMKKRYKRAFWLLRDRVVNLSSKEAGCKTFVKYEKIPIGKYEEGKPPRLIQFRDFTYVYSLKKQVLGHSLAIKSNHDIIWHFGQPAKTIFTKLYDNYGIAEAMNCSWSEFCSPVGVCLDHSKFDGHYATDLLKLEHDYWKRLNGSEELRWLLSQQFINKGVTAKGIKYKVNGTRLSGEFTTSEGNTVLNYAMIITWLQRSGIEKARVHVNGDDSVIILEHNDLNKLLPLTYFRNFNMETECDRIAYDFRHISYCQSQPIRVMKDGNLVWYMTKEPSRSLSRIQYADDRFLSVWKRYLTGVGLCEVAVSSGIPVTQQLGILLCGLHEKPLASVDKFPAKNSGNTSHIKPILEITRNDYEVAFGIPIRTQHYLESLIAGASRSSQDLATKNLNKYKLFINF